MYSYNLKEAIQEIKKQKAKKVLLHLPDGLKPKAKEIQEEIKKELNTEIFIWAGSCYGACDLPLETKNLGIDLIIHFGHTKWQN
ncbi:MAG: diphthamide synthesis protein [Nanoarchaeota archaeon]|nr:diphthamide synthesis protein [Nanoarchaeota archaeon]MBU1855173.1 diphthamide synthesis protein [Nanoarchaeota archaeon]